MLKIVVFVFCRNCGTFCSGFKKKVEVKKITALIEIQIFCNTINVFTVTFDQFNAYLLVKTSISLQIKTQIYFM